MVRSDYLAVVDKYKKYYRLNRERMLNYQKNYYSLHRERFRLYNHVYNKIYQKYMDNLGKKRENIPKNLKPQILKEIKEEIQRLKNVGYTILTYQKSNKPKKPKKPKKVKEEKKKIEKKEPIVIKDAEQILLTFY